MDAAPNAPPSHAPVLFPPGKLPALDRASFMGTWCVVWSTLPMWRTKRDVTITYTGPDSEHTIFASDVAYRPRDKPDAQFSHVRGTERLTGDPGRFVWRGNGLLFWCTSKWEVRGCGTINGVDWCVISFESTTFTPAGLDILIRGNSNDTDGTASKNQAEAVREIIQALKSTESKDLADMASGGGPVPMGPMGHIHA